jgi:hypothetical protein
MAPIFCKKAALSKNPREPSPNTGGEQSLPGYTLLQWKRRVRLRTGGPFILILARCHGPTLEE